MDPFPKDGESAATGEPSRGSAPSSGVVVQVREKKGPLRAAIPYMPFPVAVICLFLNTFVPGLALLSDKRGLDPAEMMTLSRNICICFHRAVWSPDRPPRQAHVLCLLAEHCCCSDSDPDSDRDGWLDYEYILGDGHGHSRKLQGAGDPTAAVVAGTSMVRETRREISFGSCGPRTFSLPFVSLLPFVLFPSV